MNGYVCFWKGQRIEVRSTTSYNAQTAAYNVLTDRYPRRKIKAHDITVVLAEKDGDTVVHHPLF